MHQVVVAQLAAARQGTHKTKTRGEVRGGGKKPYRQKGTGRARQGSTRAPQFAGGGIVHGPMPRDYSQRTPKKMKAAALRGALSDRAREGRVHVVDRLSGGDAPSTKAAIGRARDADHPHARARRRRPRRRADLEAACATSPKVHLHRAGPAQHLRRAGQRRRRLHRGRAAGLPGRPPKGRSAKASAVFRGDLPGSATGTSPDVAGAAAGDVDGGGTPGEDLSPHAIDSDVPSIAPAARCRDTCRRDPGATA